MSNLKLTYTLLKLNNNCDNYLEFITKSFFREYFIAELFNNCWLMIRSSSTSGFTCKFSVDKAPRTVGTQLSVCLHRPIRTGHTRADTRDPQKCPPLHIPPTAVGC